MRGGAPCESDARTKLARGKYQSDEESEHLATFLTIGPQVGNLGRFVATTMRRAEAFSVGEPSRTRYRQFRMGQKGLAVIDCATAPGQHKVLERSARRTSAHFSSHGGSGKMAV